MVDCPADRNERRRKRKKQGLYKGRAINNASLAWAHDWTSGTGLNAAFEMLPGSNFIVNGAAVPHDSALTSASAQYFFTPSWSLTAKFDGEFAPTSQTYAGTGTLRYTW